MNLFCWLSFILRHVKQIHSNHLTYPQIRTVEVLANQFVCFFRPKVHSTRSQTYLPNTYLFCLLLRQSVLRLALFLLQLGAQYTFHIYNVRFDSLEKENDSILQFISSFNKPTERFHSNQDRRVVLLLCRVDYFRTLFTFSCSYFDFDAKTITSRQRYRKIYLENDKQINRMRAPIALSDWAVIVRLVMQKLEHN